MRKQYAQNFAAYDAFLRGRKLLSPPTTERLVAARQNFARAAKLDPEGYAGISLTHSLAVRHGQSVFPPTDIEVAMSHAKIALEKNDRYGMARLAMASAQLLQRNQDEAVAHVEAAHRLHPTDANINAALGLMLTFAGRAQEALARGARPGSARAD